LQEKKKTWINLHTTEHLQPSAQHGKQVEKPSLHNPFQPAHFALFCGTCKRLRIDERTIYHHLGKMAAPPFFLNGIFPLFKPNSKKMPRIDFVSANYQKNNKPINCSVIDIDILYNKKITSETGFH